MISLSTHFVDNWRIRVGGADPAPSTVQGILHDSVRVCRGFALAQHEPFSHSLAIYWHPELNLILKVDDLTNVAVSVFTPQMPGRGRRPPCARN